MSDLPTRKAMNSWVSHIKPINAVIRAYADGRLIDREATDHDVTDAYRVGIEVWTEDMDEPARPIWREIIIRIPHGEITATEWNAMTLTEKRAYRAALGVGEDET